MAAESSNTIGPDEHLQTQDEIIEEYVSLRRLIQYNIDYVLNFLENYITYDSLEVARMLFYSIGTDGLIDEIKYRYQFMLPDWLERTGENMEDERLNSWVVQYLIERVFTYPSINPISEVGLREINSAKSIKKRYNDAIQRKMQVHQNIQDREEEFIENIMTQDQAKEHIAQMPKLNKSFKKRFKPQIEGLFRLSRESAMAETEVALLTCERSYMQTLREVQLIPEFGEIYGKGYEFANEIAQITIERFKNSSSVGFPEAVTATLKATRSFYEQMTSLEKVTTIRYGFFHSVFKEVFSILVQHFIDAYMEQNSCSMDESVKKVNEICQAAIENSPEFIYLNVAADNLLESHKYFETTGKHLENELETKEEITEEKLEDLYDELMDLFNTRKTPNVAKKIGNFHITANNFNIGELELLTRQDSLVNFSLEILDHQFPEDLCLRLSINRITGEITLTEGHLTCERFLNNNAYRSLKKLVYTAFIETLKDTNEDLTQVSPRDEETLERIKELKEDLKELTTETKPKKKKNERVRIRKEKPEPVKEPDSNKTEKVDGYKRQLRRARLRKAREEAKAAKKVTKAKEKVLPKETIIGKRVLILVGPGVQNFDNWQSAGLDNGASECNVEYASDYRNRQNGTIRTQLATYDIVIFEVASGMAHTDEYNITNNKPDSVHKERWSHGAAGLSNYLKTFDYTPNS